jgi:hypothetical protein
MCPFFPSWAGRTCTLAVAGEKITCTPSMHENGRVGGEQDVTVFVTVFSKWTICAYFSQRVCSSSFQLVGEAK